MQCELIHTKTALRLPQKPLIFSAIRNEVEYYPLHIFAAEPDFTFPEMLRLPP